MVVVVAVDEVAPAMEEGLIKLLFGEDETSAELFLSLVVVSMILSSVRI